MSVRTQHKIGWFLVFGFLSWTLGGCLSGNADFDDNKGNNIDNTIVGFWFECEFDEDDDCHILDNDGYQFTSEGILYQVQESTGNSESECDGSPCFRPDLPNIFVDRVKIGIFNFDGQFITLEVGNCASTFEVRLGEHYTHLTTNGCVNFRGLYGKYKGSVTLTQRS